MRAAIMVVLLAGCADTVSEPPLGDYTAWARIVLDGPAPGHGDTSRVVYVNDIARAYIGGRYPVGSILVKEIYEGEPGDPEALAYIAVMRRLALPDPYEAAGGWLFSLADDPASEERDRTDYCWGYCHAASPYEGVFLDYSR